MKRFMMLTACASVIVATMMASTQAQPTPRTIKPQGRVKVGADLAVVELQGVLRGSNYLLSGKVTNVGNKEYSRTLTGLNGQFEGRKIQLFAVTNGAFGKGGSSKLLRTLWVTSLQPKESLVRNFTIATSEVPGSATAQFVLKITGSDVNSRNDWKDKIVSPVD